MRFILVSVYLFEDTNFINSSAVLQELAAFFMTYSKPSETSGKFAISSVDIFLKLYIIISSNLDTSVTKWPELSSSSNIVKLAGVK